MAVGNRTDGKTKNNIKVRSLTIPGALTCDGRETRKVNNTQMFKIQVKIQVNKQSQSRGGETGVGVCKKVGGKCRLGFGVRLGRALEIWPHTVFTTPSHTITLICGCREPYLLHKPHICQRISIAFRFSERKSNSKTNIFKSYKILLQTSSISYFLISSQTTNSQENFPHFNICRVIQKRLII